MASLGSTAPPPALAPRDRGAGDVKGPLDAGHQQTDSPPGVIRPSRGVLACDHGDVVVLLALSTGRYYTLDEVASEGWREIEAGATKPALESRLCDGYTRRPWTRADVDAFVKSLNDADLTTVATSSAAAQRPGPDSIGSQALDRQLRMPPLPMSSVALAAISLALRTVGLWPVWRRAQGSHDTPNSTSRERDVSAVARRVALAATLCPLRAQCLEQSLFIVWWLRRAGIDAHLRIGTMAYPFKAHAWVEVGDEVVNDSADRIRIYRPFPRLAFEAA